MTLSFIIALLLSSPVATGTEQVIGLPCEGCQVVFSGMPGELDAHSRIAPPDEPGEPLIIEGIVRDQEGDPAPGIVVYAYQTNAKGIYPSASTRHGKLRGWALTDADGRYRFDTIRPGSYPGRQAPQHIHMHVIEPGQVTYYIDDIFFDDDPLLRDRERNRPRPRGGSGVVKPKKDESGVWHARRDITLRLNVD